MITKRAPRQDRYHITPAQEPKRASGGSWWTTPATRDGWMQKAASLADSMKRGITPPRLDWKK